MKISSKFFLFFLLLIFFNKKTSFPQSYLKVDSLWNLIKNGNDDTAKANHLIQIANEYYLNGNSDTAHRYISEALNLSGKLNFKKVIASSYNFLGNYHLNKGEYTQALDFHRKSLKIKEEIGDKQGTASSLGNIALIYIEQGNFANGLQHLLSALKIFEEFGDKTKIGGAYINIGSVYNKLNDYTQSLDFFMKALKIFEESGDKIKMAYSYTNIGNVYAYRFDYRKALDYYFKALKIFEEINDVPRMAFLYTNIGQNYYERDSVNQALEYYLKGLKIREKIDDKYGISASKNNIGKLLARQSRFSEALKYCQNALEMAREIGSKDLIQRGYECYFECYEKMGNYEEAYRFHKLYSELKDSLFNEESSKQIAEMQTKYETEKKELQIENLNKDNEIKNTEIKKQNVQKIAFASGFGLMLILAFVIFRGYKQKQKANEIITAQKTEVEKQKEIVDEKNQSLEVAYKHIEEKNTEILDSIRYAKRIQDAILPPQKLVKEYLEQSFILYKPKDIVAGDFYWVTPLPPKGGNTNTQADGIVQSQLPDIHRDGGTVLFACCDCTGHGVPGAFVSILGYNGLNRCVKEFGLTKPSEILDKLCELVDEAFSKSENDIKDGMDIALVNLTLNPSPMERDLSNAQTPLSPDSYRDGEGSGVRLQYAGAGNSLYLVRKINNETNNEQQTTNNYQLTEYAPDKQPIGKFAYRKPFTNHEIQLQKGDAIYVFTDGYADQFGGAKGKKFKYKQFENLLLSIQDKSMTEQREILNNAIDTWRGELEQIDDICVLGVRI